MPAGSPVRHRCLAGAVTPAEITINKMKNKFLITWDEYHECFATVEADSQEEAEEKWCDHQSVTFNDDCQSIDNVEICQEDEDEETLADLKSGNGQSNCGCKVAENDKSNNTLSNSGEDGTPSPHSLSFSQELKGGESKNDN